MKYLTVLFLLNFLVFSSYAQIDKNSTQPTPTRTISTIQEMEVSEVSDIDFSGGSSYKPDYLGEKVSVYLYEDWKAADIAFNDGSLLEDILIRYDLYNQQMQFVDNEDTLAFANPEEINYIKVNDSRLLYTKFVDNSAVDYTFMEVLNDGDCKLLVYKKVDYLIASDNSCIVSNHYYIKKGDNSAEEVALKCKYVVLAFSEQEKEIKNYIKENKLRFKTCKDLCKVVEYYNSLTQHP